LLGVVGDKQLSGMVDVITVVVVPVTVVAVQIVPKNVGLSVGDTAVQANDDDGLVPPQGL